MEIIAILTENPALIVLSNNKLISYVPLDTANIAQSLLNSSIRIFPSYSPSTLKVVVKAIPVASATNKAINGSVILNKYLIQGFEGINYLTREDVEILEQIKTELGIEKVLVTDTMSLYGELFQQQAIVVDLVDNIVTSTAVSSGVIRNMVMSTKDQLTANLNRLIDNTQINNVVGFSQLSHDNYSPKSISNLLAVFNSFGMSDVCITNLIIADILGKIRMVEVNDSTKLSVDVTEDRLIEDSDLQEEPVNTKKKKKSWFRRK